jgi:hypothetical protein
VKPKLSTGRRSDCKACRFKNSLEQARRARRGCPCVHDSEATTNPCLAYVPHDGIVKEVEGCIEFGFYSLRQRFQRFQRDTNLVPGFMCLDDFLPKLDLNTMKSLPGGGVRLIDMRPFLIVIIVQVILQSQIFWMVDAFGRMPSTILTPSHHNYYRPSFVHVYSSSTADTNSDTTSISSSSSMRDKCKDDLLQQIATTPSNGPTSPSATKSILMSIRVLEEFCPMGTTKTMPLVDQTNRHNEVFLNMLAGNWDLLWTTQDVRSDEWNLAGPFRRWIK